MLDLAQEDPLGTALHHLRLTGTLYCCAHLTAPWGLLLPELEGHMILLFVTQGCCELQVGDVVHHLEEGNLALLPHGTSATARSSASAPVERLADVPVQKISARYETTDYGGGGTPTRAVACVLRFDHPAAGYLLSPFPRSCN